MNLTTEDLASPIKRLLSFIVNSSIYCIICSLTSLIISIFIKNYPNIIYKMEYIPFIFLLFLFLISDGLNGQSIGKRIFNIKVVEKDTYNDISLYQSIIRNSTIFIFGPIDLLFLVKNNKLQRLGDLLSNTIVIRLNADYSSNKIIKLNIVKKYFKLSIRLVFMIFVCLISLLLFEEYQLKHGNDNLNKKNYKEALVYFNRCCILSTSYSYIYNQRGLSYLGLKEYTIAIENFNKSIKDSPLNPIYYYNIACAYSLLGNTFESLKFLKKATLLDVTFKKHAFYDKDFYLINKNKEFIEIIKE